MVNVKERELTLLYLFIVVLFLTVSLTAASIFMTLVFSKLVCFNQITTPDSLWK